MAQKFSPNDSPLRSPRPVVARFSESTKARKSYAQLYGFCDAKNCQNDRLEHENYCDRHVLTDAF